MIGSFDAPGFRRHARRFAAVDVSDLASVARFARGFAADTIDVLVHNAGVLPAARTLTADDLELTFATHVAGPHLLTRLLTPRLRASDDPRMVWVSSGGMYTQRLSLADLAWERRAYDGVRAYAQTKRMQVVLAAQWARELGASAGATTEGAASVHVSSMHPGWADTPGVETSLPRFHARLRARLRTPAEGADTIVWLAARRPAPSPSGTFWFDRRARWTHYLPWTHSRAATRAALWSLVDRLTAPFA